MDRPTGSEAKPWGWNLRLGVDLDRKPGSNRLRTICRRALAGIRAGGFSSIHRHDFQSNAFHLIEGRLLLTQYELELGRPVLTAQQILFPGEGIVIPPRKLHRFLGLEDCRLLEIYVAAGGREAQVDDIIRLTENGCDESLIVQHV